MMPKIKEHICGWPIKAVSAPLLWSSLRDRRLAVGCGLVPSIPVSRSVRDYSQRA